MIKTKQVANCRQLHFDSMDQIAAEARSLVEQEGCVLLGNWSLGQILEHMALPMVGCVEGFGDVRAPLPLRIMGRLIRNRSLVKRLPAGIPFPKKLVRLFTPKACTPEDGLASLLRGVALMSHTDVRHPSPIFGPMTREQWDQLHYRHAELHLGFVLPGGA